MHLNKIARLLLPVALIVAFLIILHLLLSDQPSITFYIVLFPVLLFAAVSLLIFYHFNLRPLNTIEKALHHRDGSLLSSLRNSTGQFGPIADLVARSFDQQEQLQREVQERKKAEEKLAEQEKMYRDLFETAQDALLCIDPEGNLLLANPASRRLLKIPDDENIIRRNLTALFAETPPAEIKSLPAATERTTPLRSIECTLRKFNGDHFTAELRFVPIPGVPDRQSSLIYITDLTDRKSTEHEKQRLQDQFRVVYKMEAIGQLAGGIAHEYNNILGAISGYADLICQRYGNDERLIKYAGMILSASKRASELTRKLLIFARKNRLNLADFNVHDALQEAIDLLRHTVDKTVTIVHRDSAQQMYIFGDVTQFQNAIMNLALNSRDAMPDGGNLTIASSIEEIDRSFKHRRDFSIAPGRYVAVSITDTGCGMDQEVLTHIFEPFFTTKDIGQGTGLGLASVYGTVKSHHGFIDVKSSPDEGTTFTLYFPLVEHTPLVSEGTVPVHSGGYGTILFIDDESILRDAVREMLTLIGYTVTTGIDGEDALSLFASTPKRYCLVILDMKMPGMSGIECYRKMKAINPDVRVLLSTGYSLDEERQAILNEGIIGIIQKPYISAQLAQAVQAALLPEAE
ncbi:MAG: response regulator [Chitinispirillaceae bacterium]|nr:response regulator [Chitinispirillaceae bacterium]